MYPYFQNQSSESARRLVYSFLRENFERCPASSTAGVKPICSEYKRFQLEISDWWKYLNLNEEGMKMRNRGAFKAVIENCI